MSYIISNNLTNNTYLTTSNSSYLTGSGSYYTKSCVSFDKTKYHITDKTVSHRGFNLPVYISTKGRAFIFAINKNGCEYKKYVK